MILSIIALIVVISSLIVGALGDGWNDKGKKVLGHAFKAAEIAILVASPFLLDVELRDALPYALVYLFGRVALFDIVRNLARGEKITYVGDSSIWDRLIKRIPGHGMMFYRGIALIASIGLGLKLL